LTIFIIIATNGKAVQSWSFAEKKHILFCDSPDWAMPFPSKKAAEYRVDYLKKHFPKYQLNAVEIEKKVEFNIKL
jgi:hypothetical protein